MTSISPPMLTSMSATQDRRPRRASRAASRRGGPRRQRPARGRRGQVAPTRRPDDPEDDDRAEVDREAGTIVETAEVEPRHRRRSRRRSRRSPAPARAVTVSDPAGPRTGAPRQPERDVGQPEREDQARHGRRRAPTARRTAGPRSPASAPRRPAQRRRTRSAGPGRSRTGSVPTRSVRPAASRPGGGRAAPPATGRPTTDGTTWIA